MGSYVFQPRGKGYAFRIAVPKDLQGRFRSEAGKPLLRIVEGLNTDSVKEAEAKAAKRRAHWLAVFERAKKDVPLTLGEIEDAAREVYTTTLARMANDATISPDPDEILWLPADLQIRETALDRNDATPVRPEIEAIQRRHGVELDPASPTYRALGNALLRAQIAAITGRIRALQGKATERPATFLGPDGIDPTTLKPITLTRPIARLKTERGPWSLFEQWIAEARPAASTVNRWRAVFLNLQSKFGSDQITADDAREWARGLVTNARSARTVAEVWVNGARTVYNWAVEQRLANGNPFSGIKITVPEPIETRESKAFTSGEAATILRAASAIEPNGSAFKAAQRWVPWLQAYSGARAGEIAQLRGQDVMKQDGVWVMKLTPEAGTVKTRKPRIVPLHEHLIAQGFPDFVKGHGAGGLFYNDTDKRRSDTKPNEATNPQRPRAVKTRERLAAWIRDLGVTDKAVSPTHGWRHLFKQIAEGAGISERLSDYITGHAPATIGRKYGAPQVVDLANALTKFPRYPI